MRSLSEFSRPKIYFILRAFAFPAITSIINVKELQLSVLSLVFLFLCPKALAVVNAEGQTFQDEFEISAHKESTCAIDKNGIKCWGWIQNNHPVPSIAGPWHAVSVGDGHACAIRGASGSREVLCWGNNSQGQTSIPSLSNPRQLSAGDQTTCALDDNGLQCWGSDLSGIVSSAPSLVSGVKVEVGRSHACALDIGGFQCWGSDTFGQISSVPALSGVTDFDVGAGVTCAIHSSGTDCWGENGMGQATVPALSSPIDISNYEHTCAIDGNVVKCWGQNNFGQANPPSLLNPKQIAVGSVHSCAVDNNGIRCWGGNSEGQTTAPSMSFYLGGGGGSPSGGGNDDDDNDGVPNADDLFPLDPTEFADSDGDGVGDNADSFPLDPSRANDLDLDGVDDKSDNCPESANGGQFDFDGDGRGDACDSDDDNDGFNDESDTFPFDASEHADADGDGIGNYADDDDDNDGILDVEDVRPEDPIVRGIQYLQTTAKSNNVTMLDIVNTSNRTQRIRGTLVDGKGNVLGEEGLELGYPNPPMGRLTINSNDLETVFGVDSWDGPAVLFVKGTGRFELMSRLTSPSGLVSNTNCVRENRVLNLEGFDSENLSYIRFINTTDERRPLRGTLYDQDGRVVGDANTFFGYLDPLEQIWLSRDEIAEEIGAEWSGEGMLELAVFDMGVKLLNLNYIMEEETFLNFSCFENEISASVFLQTSSTSQNVSLTHLVNTSDENQTFTGTLYASDGSQVGVANQPLHESPVPPKARLIISSEDLEQAFDIGPWEGPAMLEVSGFYSFELMTKLKSPSGLISNTNCVRREHVHNIGGFDQTDISYVRFINTGQETLREIRGTLYNSRGKIIGWGGTILIPELPAKAQVWLSRDKLSDLVNGTWNGLASLRVNKQEGIENLILLNLNLINNETFFNFSCYESGQ